MLALLKEPTKSPRANLHTRWILLAAFWLIASLGATAIHAGTTHSEGGAVVEAPSVPETDGTATVQVYWTGDSATRTTATVGATLAGHWLLDAGHALTRQWMVGDVHVAMLERQTGAGTAAHAGYYGISTKALTSLDPDEFTAMTVRPIPVPIATPGAGFINLAWTRARSSGGPSGIAGYNLYRSTNGIAFSKLNAMVLTDSTYQDAGVTFGTNYYYALGLAFTGTPVYQGSVLSANSSPATPLDTTPPSIPVLTAEPPFTEGTTNLVAWASEAASGATHYSAEYALDSAFTTVAGTSGWITDTSFTFSNLTDGQNYFYRVRARDAAMNLSGYSGNRSSRQDATPPASHLLQLTAFKASSLVNLEWTAEDATSGVSSVQLFYAKDGGAYVMVPGGPWTESPIAFDAATTGGDGTYAFYTRAADAVANAEAAPEAPDTSTIVDTQAPIAPALLALPAFSAGTSRLVNWNSTAASGATEYRVQASDSEDFATLIGESGWQAGLSFAFAGLTDGMLIHYRVRSRDAAGNESAMSPLVASTQDASPPATQASALSEAMPSHTFDVAWTGGDATSGLSGIELWFSRNGGAFTQLPGGPWTSSPIGFDASLHGGDGTYTFYTIGTDALGQAEAAPASADATTHVDTAAPGQPVIAALPSFSVGTSRSIAWSGTDADQFRAEMATDAAFTNVVAASGWIAAANWYFTSLIDGQEYFYRVRGRDLAGNTTPYSPTASSTQDATAPTSAMTALPDFSAAMNLALEWTGSDATSGIAAVDLYYAKDGGAETLYAGSPFGSSPIAFDAAMTGGDGHYAFYIRARDAAGNRENAPAAADAETTIDTAAPAQPMLVAMPNFTMGTTREVSWSGSNADEFMAQAATDAAFSEIVAASGWTSGATYPFSGLTDGAAYFFRVHGRDLAGNETAFSNIETTMLDATAPATEASELAANSGTRALSIAWTGSDATSGVTNVDLYYSKDGGAFGLYFGGPWASSPIAFDASAAGGDGMYTFYTRGHDTAGNLEAAPGSADASTRVDTSAPGAPTIAGLQTFEPGNAVNVGWSDESASGAAEYLAEMSTMADFAVLEASSGWQAEHSFLFADLSDGQHYYVRVKARDDAMNETGWSGQKSTTMDATPPVSAVVSLPAMAASLVLDIAWSGSDATSGLENVDLYVARNGGIFSPLPGGPFDASPIHFDATAMGDGAYAFYTRAHDGAGNLEAAPAAADGTILLDTSAPEVPTLAALPIWSASTDRILDWSNESASGAVEYQAQASSDPTFAILLAQSPWTATTSHTFTGLSEGATYHYRVKSRDAAGNESTFGAIRSSMQDAGAPVSELASLPALGNDATLDLAWSGADAHSGLANVDLYYSRNGGADALYGNFTASPIAFDATTTGGDGAYAFYTRARDIAGNLEAAPASAEAQTTLDTAAPAIPTLAALPRFTPGGSVNLAWTDESLTGAMSYHAEMSASSNFATIIATSGWTASHSFWFGSLTDGLTYWFRVKSRDAALNESAYAAGSTAMDNTPPVSIVTALPSVTSTAAFDIAWSGSDATSGIADVDLYYSREGGAYTLHPGSPFNTTPIAFNSATTGGEGQYAFYTRARDAAGNRELPPGGADATTIVSTSATGTPTIASIPSFTMGTSRTISWTPGANNATFLVQAAGDAAFTSIHAASGWIASASHTFHGLADGTHYWYRVKARNAIGIEGSYSLVAQSTQDATAPSTGVASMPATRMTQQFDIAWSGSDATSGIAAIELHVSHNGSAYAVYPGGPFATSPIAFDAATTGGDGTYAFYTRATDGAGNLEAAPVAPDATTRLDSAAPNAPAMAAEPASTQGSTNTVGWNTVADATQYFAQCSSDEFFLNVVATTGWTAATSHTFTSLAPGETYWYRVRARDAAGNSSGYSAAVASAQSESYILEAGWNLVSFNVTPSDPRIDLALSSIGGSYTIVRGYSSSDFHTYVPTLPFEWNDLTSVSPLSAYWIYMSRPDTLSVAGTPTSPSTPIHLESGWNLAGYLPSDPRTPNLALFSIAGSYALARGYEPGAGYRSFYPSLPGVSDLADMRSGEGYWLYMTAADELIYGGALKSSELEAPVRGRAPATRRPVEKGAGSAVPTVMDVWSRKVTVDGEAVPAGTVIEAYDADGTLCGSATVRTNGSLGLLHLRGDISVSESDEGAVAGETLAFRIRDLDAKLISGPIVWQADGLQEAKLDFASAAALLPRAFALAQNLPNPFNPTTKIAYAIPGNVDGAAIEAIFVRLHVYDIRGRRVATLVNGVQTPGHYTAVWNGRDATGQSAPSGVYFYRLETDRFTKARKMMLVK